MLFSYAIQPCKLPIGSLISIRQYYLITFVFHITCEFAEKRLVMYENKISVQKTLNTV